MANVYGPKIVRDGLVLYLDKYNKRSYLGEPATNLLSSGVGADINGRFGPGNQWGTYNASQYNSNSYFTLGIASVSSNIVTFNSYGGNSTTLRTYDAIFPQTSGGGVTSGTYYFIKRLDSGNTGTFTLHAYNASQDGSQGYINPVTGHHKVHDSLYLNGGTPISISSSSFPTSWWGYAHKPNQHIVKELISEGGPENQRFIRLWAQGMGWSDALAYGVYGNNIQLATTYSLSFWYRGNTGQAFSLTHWYGGGGVYGGTPPTSSLIPTDEWQFHEKQWTTNGSQTYGNLYSYFTIVNSGVGTGGPHLENSTKKYVDICDYQIEANSHATRFTGSTARSATDGWRDLTGNGNHADLTALTYTATNVPGTHNNDFSFDGVDDRAISGDVYSASAMTISAWVNLDVVPASQPQSYNCILSKRDVDTQRSYFLAWQKASSKLYWELKNSNGTYFIQYSTKTNWSASQWYNIVATYTASTGIAKMYVDGVEDAGTFNPSQPWGLTPIPDTTANTVVGGSHGGYYEIQGEISSVLFHNRALTATEVLQNFNAHKGRYGL